MVRSNSVKRAADPALSSELKSWEHSESRDGDSTVQARRRGGFLPKTAVIREIAE